LTADDATPRGPLAPRWHTALLVALYLSVAVVGSLLPDGGAAASALPGGHGRVVARYLPLLLVQWGTLLYVARVGRPRSALRALLGAPWSTPRRAAADLALAAAAWAAIRATELAWARVAAGASAPAVAALLPRTPAELLAWAIVSASVGFCEEVVFRGYLLAQFEAFLGRAWVAVALQAALFGLAHAEQGPAAAARAALYGLGLGALARWRGGLAPGIACHVATDLASGLAR
jgi:membrane protease YdiL (CAAX protease family)